MAETSGPRFDQIKPQTILGAGPKGQSCDGTFTPGNVPKYTSDGTLTDSGDAPGAGGGTPVEEIPSGTLNGSNPTFTLSFTPIANSLNLLLNGVAQVPNGVDFTLSGSTITMRIAPKARDTGYFIAQYTR